MLLSITIHSSRLSTPSVSSAGKSHSSASLIPTGQRSGTRNSFIRSLISNHLTSRSQVFRKSRTGNQSALLKNTSSPCHNSHKAFDSWKVGLTSSIQLVITGTSLRSLILATACLEIRCTGFLGSYKDFTNSTRGIRPELASIL